MNYSTGGIVSEFKRVINCQPLHTKLGTGCYQENIHKNRDVNIIPCQLSNFRNLFVELQDLNYQN